MRASEDAETRQMRASEEAEKAKSLYLNPGPDVKNPTGLYVKPEFDDKNADGKTGVNLDFGWRAKIPVHTAPDQIVLHGASDEYVNRRNQSYQDSLKKSGIDPTGKILFIKG